MAAAEGDPEERHNRLVGGPQQSFFPDANKVTYITDVEGHWDYFCSYVQVSAGISFVTTGDKCKATESEDLELQLEDGWHFVFGGDSCDKGLGTLRFLESIVRLKWRHPDRVHLLIGNRDINKIRWTSELDEAELARFVECAPAYWVRPQDRKSIYQYLRELAARELDKPEAEVTAEDIAERNTKANKMRMCLKHDMGSDGEMEFRRQELAVMRACSPMDVSDEDCIASYQESVQPGGWMRRYLHLAQLGVLLGDVLFVHGQIVGNQFPHGQVHGADESNTAWCLGVIPGEERPEPDVRAWLERLNTWSFAQICDWISRPTWEKPPTESSWEDWRGRGGADLIQYGTPGTIWPTVVYNRWLDSKCMPLEYPADLVDHLVNNGIRFVVVGHTPHGNAPTIIRSKGSSTAAGKNSVVVVMADTSYSMMGSNEHFIGDNRGQAVTDVSFLLKDGVRQCHVRGYTEKQQIVDYKVAPSLSSGLGDPLVGLIQEALPEQQQRFYVKAVLPPAPGSSASSNVYLMNSICGFKYDYAVMTEEEVRQMLEGSGVPTVVRRVVSGSGDIFGHSFSGNDAESFLTCLFGMLDIDRDGTVTKKELLQACTDKVIRQALMAQFPDMSVQSIMEELDLDQDGHISMQEFLMRLLPKCESTNTGGGVYFEVLADVVGEEEAVSMQNSAVEPFPAQLMPVQLKPPTMLSIDKLKVDWGHCATWAGEGRDCEFPCDAVPPETLEQVLGAVPDLAGPPLRGFLSPLHPVNLSEAGRKAAQIPEEARHFAYSYPFTVDGRPLPGKMRCYADPDAAFLRQGGFVYFNSQLRVVGLLAAITGSFASGSLKFGPPKEWLPKWTSAFRNGNRWNPCTDIALIRGGATDFAWVRPFEVVGGKLREGGKAISKYGAFAFLMGGPLSAICRSPTSRPHSAAAKTMHGLNGSEMVWLKQVFDWCDENADGYISYSELQVACTQRPDIAYHLGLKAHSVDSSRESRPELDLDALFSAIDQDGGGTITFEELCMYYAKHPDSQGNHTPEEIEAAQKDFLTLFCRRTNASAVGAS